MADREERDDVEAAEEGAPVEAEILAEFGGEAAGEGEHDDAEDEEADEEEGEVDEEEDEEGNDVPPEPVGPDNSRARFEGHADAVYAVATSPDGALVASGGGDDLAYLWRAADGGLVATLKGHADSVVAVAFSASGALLATGSYDGVVKVWDGATGAPRCSIEGPGSQIEWLTWHPRGDVLLAGSGDGSAWMWALSKAGSAATCMQVFVGHEAEVTCGSFSGGAGKHVVTASADGSAKVWNPKTGACTVTVGGHGWHRGPITCLALAGGDKPLLLTGAQDGTAVVSNMSNGRVVSTLRHAQPKAPGDRVGAGAGAGSRRQRRAEEAEDDDVPKASVEAVGFCDSHPWAASGCTDGSLIVWDLATGSARHSWALPEAVIRLSWLPGSPLLAVASGEGAVRLLDGRDGKQVAIYTGHAGMVLDIALLLRAPDAKAAVAAAAGGASAATGGENAPSAAAAVAAAPKAPAVAVITAGDDNTCRVYDFPQ